MRINKIDVISLLLAAAFLFLFIWITETSQPPESPPMIPTTIVTPAPAPTPTPTPFEQDNPQSRLLSLTSMIGAGGLLGTLLGIWALFRVWRRFTPRTLKKMKEIEAAHALSSDRGEWGADDWRFMMLGLEQYYKAALRKISSLESSLLEKEGLLLQAAKALDPDIEELRTILDEHEETIFQKNQEVRTLELRLKETEHQLAVKTKSHDELVLTLEQREQALAALQAQSKIAEPARTWQEIMERLTEFHRKRHPTIRASRDLARWLGCSIPNKENEAFSASVRAIYSPPPSKAPPETPNKGGEGERARTGGADGGADG